LNGQAGPVERSLFLSEAKNPFTRLAMQPKTQVSEIIDHGLDDGNQALSLCFEEDTQGAGKADTKLPRVVSSQPVVEDHKTIGILFGER
jgi:hypothetical protein